MKKRPPPTSETSALDSADFSPKYPAHETQAARLLAVALLGQKINPLRGWKSLGIYRLSDTKFRLRAMGWPMDNAGLDVKNRFSEQCHVALYYLHEWAIEAAGERGQKFAQRELEFMARKKAA